MTDTKTLLTVKCRGCHRQVGVSSKDYPVYCSPWCADQPSATSDEERDSLIEALARIRHLTPTQIAVRFSLTRQRVHQILQDRHVPREYA